MTITFDLEIESIHCQPISCRAQLLAFESTPPIHICLPSFPHPPRPTPGHQDCGVWWPTARTAVDSSSSAGIYKVRSPYIYILHIIQGSPLGCVSREIPGVTQVDEKGHEGNTAVVTVHLRWSKHGQRNSRTGVPAVSYYSFI